MSAGNNVLVLAEQYNKQINNIIEVTKVVENTFQHISNTTNIFNIQLNQAAEAADGMNKELGKVKEKASCFETLKGKLSGIISLQDIAKKGFDMVGKGLGIATELQKSEHAFGGLLGNAQAGSGLFNHIAKQARTSSLSIEDMAANTQGFLGVSRNVQDIDQLNKMSEKLAVLNPTGQDAKGAGGALQQALKGESSALTKDFGIDAGALQNSGFQKAVNMGDTTKAIDILDQLMNKTGYTQEGVDSMVSDLSSQWKLFTSKMSTDFGMAMRAVADTIVPIVMKFNELRESGVFQPIIDTFVTGINLIAMGLTGIVDGFIWLGEVISANWDIIGAVLAGIAIWLLIIAATYLPTMIGELWAMVAPVLMQAAAWMMIYSPILVVIAMIAVLIYAFGQMGVTFEQVVGVIGGAIGALIGVFYNCFIYLYNRVAAFVNFFGNVFTHPIASVQKLFYDMAVNVLGFIENIAQGIQDLLNHIPGVKVNITSGITNLKNDLAAQADKIKDENQLQDFMKQEKYKSLISFTENGSNIAGGFYEKAGKMINNLKPNYKENTSNLLPGSKNNSWMPDSNAGVKAASGNGAMPVTGPNGGNVPVSVSEEDIQYIKDMAEREYIARFNTATLAPNVNVSFGDVHETADANKIVGILGKLLKEEIAVAAEG